MVEGLLPIKCVADIALLHYYLLLITSARGTPGASSPTIFLDEQCSPLINPIGDTSIALRAIIRSKSEY